MHLDAAQIQRVVDRESLITETALTDAHLVVCAECRTAVSAAVREQAALFSRLEALDNAPRAVSLQTVRATAHATVHATVHAIPDATVQATVRRPRANWPVRWAAMLLAGVGIAGAAYALPYAALRAWVRSQSSSRVPAMQPPPSSGPAVEADFAGVAVAPGVETRVQFTSVQTTGEARVVVTDDRNIEVRAPTGAATFAAGTGGVTIENAGATASYEIRIPRTAAHIEILVAGARVWTKRGERTASEYVAGSDGVVRIPLRRE